MSLIEVIQEGWFLRALSVCVMVGVTCGILGSFIVLRNMSLIGDALSHSVLPGIVIAFIIAGQSSFAFFGGAVISGFITAILITWLQQKIKAKNDAAIGIVFSTMFSVGVIGISYLSRNHHVHIDLKDFLFGNILGISSHDVVITSIIAVYVVASIALLYKYFFAVTFQEDVAKTMGINTSLLHYFMMILLSFTVVSSMQAVGVILVVSLLIIPANCALLLSYQLKKVLFISAFIGILGCVFGLVFSVVLKTTPGPLITVVLAVFYGLTILFSPKKGLIIQYLIHQKNENKILREDVLKYLSLLNKASGADLNELFIEIKSSKNKIEQQIFRLIKEKMVVKDARNKFVLTENGVKESNKIIRAHRLWESYLVERLGISIDEIHNWAEIMEHDIDEKMIEKLNQRLNFPDTDPHGSVIPK